MFRTEKITLAQAKEQILLQIPEPIKIKGIDSIPPEMTLKEFLVTFFTKWNLDGNHTTIFVKNETNQCHKGARRSLGDLWMLVKYYFPKLGLLQVKRVIEELFDENQLRTSCCGVIKKRVFYANLTYPSAPTIDYHPEKRDEFGLLFKEKFLKPIKNVKR